MTIDELVQKSYEAAREKGFHDEPPNVGEKLMLVVSELAEALEEARSPMGLMRLNLTYTGTDDQGVHKPEGFPIELADAVIRIADLCGALNIGLQDAINTKMAYNQTRPRKHGKSF